MKNELKKTAVGKKWGEETSRDR